MIKKILFTLFITIFSIGIVNASSEEDKCFKILNNQMKKDSRFSGLIKILPKGNLEEVLLDEKSGSYLNLSKYDNFQKYLVKNPAFNNERKSKGLNENDFLSRRNNIATLIATDNYIVSQVVGFGRDSNFDFPVETKGKPFGDKYKLEGPNFKEFVLYTHHSIKGDFLSCGIFHLTPLNGRTYGNVAETGYFTNVLQGNKEQENLGNKKCSSGFEGEYIKDGSDEFYSMKTNVCAIDYAQKDFVKQEILAVAYNNKSDFFNEYVIFPLQVSAMKNTDLTSNGLAEVREKFLEYVTTKTCLSLVHKNISNLPSGCKNKHSSELVKNERKLFSFLNNIIPVAEAARKFNFTNEDFEASKGIVIYESLPYDLHQKLIKIPNKNFIEYIKLALTPNFEEYIKYRKNNNILLSNYEEIFLNCDINYKEREKIIIDFLTDLKEPEKFNIENISYSNKKFGDCIIPYPDKENRSIVIEGSFPSNKILAEKLNGNYVGEDINIVILKMIEEENTLSIEHQKNIDNITNNFKEGLINSDEFEEKISIEKENYNRKNKELEEKINKIISNNGNLTDNNLIEKEKNGIFMYVIILLILITGFILVFKSYNKKNNK